MGWLRRAHALALLALQLILAAQSSHGASESECNSMSIEEEGILCYALEDECKCDRPCAVYVGNPFKKCKKELEGDPSMCVATGYCDNAWDQRNLLRPMSSGLLAPDVNAVEMIIDCKALDCEKPSSPDPTCVDKAATSAVTDDRTPWQCGCEEHPDYNVQMSGRALVEGDRKLLLGAFKDPAGLKEYQYENWQGPICDRIDLNLLCPLKVDQNYYRGWTLYLSSPTCNSQRFVVGTYKTANPTLERFTGAGWVETTENINIPIGTEVTFSLKWLPMEDNDWLGCGTQCQRSFAGTSVTVPTTIQVVAEDETLPMSYSVALYDPNDFAQGLLCYANEGVPPIRSRTVESGDTEGVTFVLQDGDHVIEIMMESFCFYEIITVSGAAEAVLFVEDVFWRNYGEWPNIVVLGGYSAYTSSPLPGSIEYAIYDASECAGPYYESEIYETDPPYECAYAPVLDWKKYAGEGAGCLSAGAGKWHVLLGGSYVLRFQSWGYQDIWIPFQVIDGEILYMDDIWDWWWMEWGWLKFQSQISFPAVSSIDGLVTKSNTWYAVFSPDENGSFEFIDTAFLDSSGWAKMHPGPAYLELDAGSYVIYFWSDGYMYSWTYLDVWYSEYLDLPPVFFVPELAAGQVQFVMQWRYTCKDDNGLTNYDTCPAANTYAPCVDYSSSPQCSRWGSAEVDTMIIPSTGEWDGDGYAWWASSFISSGGAEIEFDENYATGGFGETTRFTDLYAAATQTQEYVAWVNAYYGADKEVSSGGFSEYQVEVSVYCGPDTCEDSSNPGSALAGGRIYSAVLPSYATSAFWWSSGKLSAGGEHGNLVQWMPCDDESCVIFNAQNSPATPLDSAIGVADGGAWMSSYITGLYQDNLPNELTVSIDFYHLGMKQMVREDVKFKDYKDAMIVLPRGRYEGTYKAPGYASFKIFFEVWETYFGREDLTLDPPFFIPALSQGEVRMVMKWDYDCTGEGAGGGSGGVFLENPDPTGETCPNPEQPIYDDWRGGAGEIDTLIMPTVSDWSGEGYAYWDSSKIQSSEAVIEFDADKATGGYPETTVFQNLHLARTPVSDYQCWTHAYSGLDGCIFDECTHSFAYGQVKVYIVCGPDTCVDEDAATLPSGVIYTSIVPEGAADGSNQLDTGIYWWMPGTVSALASGKVQFIPCTGEECMSSSDAESPYLYGGDSGRIISFADHKGSQTLKPAAEMRGAGQKGKKMSSSKRLEAKATEKDLKKRKEARLSPSAPSNPPSSAPTAAPTASS